VTGLAGRRARAALLAAALAQMPAVAFAHAHLAAATPAADSTVAAPAEVVLRFTQALEGSFSAVEVRDTTGARVDDGAPRLLADGGGLAIGVRPLPPGRYQVIWHATSVDTHRTEGSFVFTVRP
jgi:methionine-rich copper-binding protein CopC